MAPCLHIDISYFDANNKTVFLPVAFSRAFSSASAIDIPIGSVKRGVVVWLNLGKCCYCCVCLLRSDYAEFLSYQTGMIFLCFDFFSSKF